MNATATPAPTPIAAKCSTTNCDKGAELRLTLVADFAPVPAMSWDVCYGCAGYMRAACANLKMDPLQCPGCLRIQPNQVGAMLTTPGPSTAGLYECGACGGIYGETTEPDLVRRPLWCNCGHSHEGTYYYDLTTPSAEFGAIRTHGWACGHCQGITQVG